MEGTYQIATGLLVSLSEQQLIDCSVDEGNIGCGGGDVSYALQYVLDNKGLDSEDDYSYQSSDAVCWTEVNTKQTNKQSISMHLRSLSHVLSLASRSLGGSRSLSPHAGKGRFCAPQLAHAPRIRDPAHSTSLQYQHLLLSLTGALHSIDNDVTILISISVSRPRLGKLQRLTAWCNFLQTMKPQSSRHWPSASDSSMTHPRRSWLTREH